MLAVAQEVFLDDPGNKDVGFTTIGLEFKIVRVLCLEEGHSTHKPDEQGDKEGREEGQESGWH